VAKKTLDEIERAYFKNIVSEGGGVYVGIQNCDPLPYDLLLFNANTGSTLAVRTDTTNLPAAISKRLAEHEAQWKRN